MRQNEIRLREMADQGVLERQGSYKSMKVLNRYEDI